MTNMTFTTVTTLFIKSFSFVERVLRIETISSQRVGFPASQIVVKMWWNDDESMMDGRHWHCLFLFSEIIKIQEQGTVWFVWHSSQSLLSYANDGWCVLRVYLVEETKTSITPHFFQSFDRQRSQFLPSNGWHHCLLEGFWQDICQSVERLTKINAENQGILSFTICCL